ncbi:polyadenylate-binding protein-interacting protein 1-like [Liolophura sinensis]|uniref:polyadenylate-binding protein-interacting protein 1-like n=1 Tax=Liolophura sinensis TaxID=3198878 RepID=UPI0031590E84
MSDNYNAGGDEGINANLGNQRPLRRPMPETEAKLRNRNQGEDKTKGRPVLGSQQVPQENQPSLQPSSLAYPNLNQNQNPVHSSQTWGSGLSADAPVFVPGQAFASSLSANAKEFVPRVQNFSTPADIPQPQYNVSLTPAEMAEYEAEYEAEERLYEQFQRLVSVRPPHLSSVSATSDSGAIELIKSTIHYLTTNPGQIDIYMGTVVSQLHQHTLNEATVNKIIESLIEQGISEPNFRYTGAKMCQFMARNLNLPNQPTFRQAFLKRFQQEFRKKDAWINNPSQHQRICGLTLFLGELFLNMEVEGPNNIMVKFGALRTALKDLLLTLLTNVTDLTIKTACQLLKLSGATIQDTEALNMDSGADASYDSVFRKLQEVSQSPTLNQTSRMLISSVLSLRETNWGRKESTSSDSSQDARSTMWDGLHFGLNEPVFYDEHGQPISREQAGFFLDEGEEDFADFAFDSGDVAYPAWANDDSAYDAFAYEMSSNMYGAEGDMDEEMEAAYEEFLRSQGHS